MCCSTKGFHLKHFRATALDLYCFGVGIVDRTPPPLILLLVLLLILLLLLIILIIIMVLLNTPLCHGNVAMIKCYWTFGSQVLKFFKVRNEKPSISFPAEKQR